MAIKEVLGEEYFSINKEMIMNTSIKTIVLSVSMACLSSVAMAGGGYHHGTVVSVDTNLTNTLDAISKQGKNGVALNLAVNTGDVDASVNTIGKGSYMSGHPFQYDSTSINVLQGEIKTTAIGAVNNGTITLEQGNMTSGSGGEFSKELSGYVKHSVSSATTNTASGAEQSSAAHQAASAHQAAESASSEGWHHSVFAEASNHSNSANHSASNSDASNYYLNDTTNFSAAGEAGMNAAISGSHYEYDTSTLSNYAAANVAFNSGSIDASVNTTGFDNTLGNITTTAIGAANTGTITVTVK